MENYEKIVDKLPSELRGFAIHWRKQSRGAYTGYCAGHWYRATLVASSVYVIEALD